MNVLVVDDDPVLLKLEAQVIRGAGHTVQTAASGKEALALLARFSPDLVLLDILMPDMDGFETAAAIRDQIVVPIVLVSVVKAAGESLLRGASGFIEKPLNPARVLETVQRAVGSTASATVLVVDDDPAILGLYSAILGRSLDVREALDGLEALDVLEVLETSGEGARLVITDLRMPRLDGVGLIRTLRADPRWVDLPVLVQTSLEVGDRKDLISELGVEKVFEKGDFARWLLDCVKQHTPALS